MPRRKITLEDAYRIFDEHGLHVEVTPAPPAIPLDHADLFEHPAPPVQPPVPLARGMVRIVLHAKHSIATGGFPILDKSGKTIGVDGAGVTYYGPGPCTVPAYLAGDLMHQDQLAQHADAMFLDRTFRSRIIIPATNGQNIARLVSEDPYFDMSGFLGQVGNGRGAFHLPF